MMAIYYLCLAIIFFMITTYKLLFPDYTKTSPYLSPSPPALPFIGHLHLLIKKPLHRTLSAITAADGPVLLRLGVRPALVVSSPTAAEECFTKNDAAFANRPRVLAGKHMGYNYTTLAHAPYGPRWRNLRRIVHSEVFSPHSVAAFSDVRRQEVRSLSRKLFELSRCQCSGMDMKSLFVDLVRNVITRVAVGSWELEVGQLNELVKESFLVGGAPNLGDFLPALRWVDLLGEEKRVMRLQGKRDRLLQELVDDRRRRGLAGQEGKKTLLDALLDLQKLDPK